MHPEQFAFSVVSDPKGRYGGQEARSSSFLFVAVSEAVNLIHGERKPSNLVPYQILQGHCGYRCSAYCFFGVQTTLWSRFPDDPAVLILEPVATTAIERNVLNNMR